MFKSRISKTATIFIAVMMLIGCVVTQALAADLTVVEIWKPETLYQATSPNTVYMEDDNDIEKIAWKTFLEEYNPGISSDGFCSAKCYSGNNNDSSTNLLYSYTFDAGDIDEALVGQHPYYVGLHTTGNDVVTADLGCRTKFPMAMEITIPTGLDEGEDVTVAYVTGSCDGYAPCKATSWAQIQAPGGSPDYLDGFDDTFTSYDTTTDADGCVTFTTYHGGEYTISYQ